MFFPIRDLYGVHISGVTVTEVEKGCRVLGPEKEEGAFEVSKGLSL